MKPAMFASAVALLAFLAAPAVAGESPRQTVIDFVGAFSRHDLPALLALTHPDIEWLTVDGSGVAIETRGQEALASSLRSYFESCPTCQSTVEVSSVIGNFVAAIESVSWQSKDVAHAQASLSVYEFLDGRVRRVWYYPAVAR